MKNRYEALLVLNSQGKEESVHDIVERLESEFKKEGAEIEQVQKMDKRQFAYAAGPLDACAQDRMARRTSLQQFAQV